MNRRLFLALAGVFGLSSRAVSRTYSVDASDSGQCFLDRIAVRAVSCNEAEGWAICHVDKWGSPARISMPVRLAAFRDGRLIRKKFYGVVEFVPRVN